MFTIDPTSLPVWQRLTNLAETVGSGTIRRHMENEDRTWMDIEAPALFLDFSRQRITREVFNALLQLADDVELDELRDAMFAGEHINTTEDRAVAHMALRMPHTSSFIIDGKDVVPDVHQVLRDMAAFAEGVRGGTLCGSTGERFRSIINIGIGGSDLGPAMAYQALQAYADPELNMFFVSNVDPADLARVLAKCDPSSTLFLIASKTFTTSETMANAQSAKAWIVDALGEASIDRHMVAISTNQDMIKDFGISRSFGFWDWVGGRFSLDSAIGLSTMIAIGERNFTSMLHGFHVIDEHFRTTPNSRNLPVVMGLIDIWNRNFLNIPTVAVMPYSHALNRFPAFLQQLVMESNGKSVRRDGSVIAYPTAAVYWGESGTNGQHSFFQLLHQGTSDVACQLICFARNSNERGAQHDVLIANALAQASVLANGRSLMEIADGSTHKVIPGNRPTSILWGQELDPFTFGALVCTFEHVVFVQGAIWGINSFDQWGVELGKVVAQSIMSYASDPQGAELDPATIRSIARYQQLRLG